jgi:hypothetical protein
MSAAYSTLTFVGILASGSSRLVATGSPAPCKAVVGWLLRLSCTSAGSAWQLVQLASPEIGSTVSTVASVVLPFFAYTRTSG